MKPIKITTDGDGNGRVKNPHGEFEPNPPVKHSGNKFPNKTPFLIQRKKWRLFDKANPPMPVFQDGVLFKIKGEFQAVVKYQYEPQDEDYLEWRDCDESFYNAINRGNERYPNIQVPTRQIFEIITPQVVGDEKEEIVKSDTGTKYKKGGVQEDAFFAILNGLSEAPDHWHLIQPFVDGAQFGANWQLKQPAIATTDSKAMDEICNHPSLERIQSLNGYTYDICHHCKEWFPIVTSDTNAVEELAAEKYPLDVDEYDISHILKQVCRRDGFISGHTEAAEALKEKVEKLKRVNYPFTDRSDGYNQAIIDILKLL